MDFNRKRVFWAVTFVLDLFYTILCVYIIISYGETHIEAQEPVLLHYIYTILICFNLVDSMLHRYIVLYYNILIQLMFC